MNEVYEFLVTFAGIIFTLVLGAALFMYLIFLMIRGEVEYMTGENFGSTTDYDDTRDTVYPKGTILKGFKAQRDKLNALIELMEKTELNDDQLLFLEDDFNDLVDNIQNIKHSIDNKDYEELDNLDDFR